MKRNFVFDTCALKSISQKDIDFHKTILEALNKMNVFIPEIVKEEYINLGSHAYETENLGINNRMKFTELSNIIDSLANFSKLCSYYELDTSLIKKNIETLNSININDMTKEFKEFSKLEQKKREVYFSEFLYNFEIIPFSLSDRYSEMENARIRFENKIPPGYEDKKSKNKTPLNKYNDYFIWKSIMDYFSNGNLDVVFVTDDAKDTSKEVDNNYMTREFFENTNINIELMSSNDFIKNLEVNGMLSGDDEIRLESELQDKVFYKAEESILKLDFTDEMDNIIDELKLPHEKKTYFIGTDNPYFQTEIISLKKRRIYASIEVYVEICLHKSGFGKKIIDIYAGLYEVIYEYNVISDVLIEVSSSFETEFIEVEKRFEAYQ